ncbi:hypothetical protein AN964_16710 [Heyndrickxia shackletonii]|uniref:Uncharacterized protein n=1 Tax=Heyndrickxia shackletonii TaxID=157838 RepID=A0A0Q3X075_9BACI|nr:hypothetical protein AN964_16710 [Heyndrickxia shackletonii]
MRRLRFFYNPGNFDNFQILNEIENHFKVILMFSVYNMFNVNEKEVYIPKANSQKSHVFMMVTSIFQKIYSWKSK